MVAKVTQIFAASCLLMLFNSLTIAPSRAQTGNHVQLPQNNFPSLPQLPLPQDVQAPSPRTLPTLPSPPAQLPPPSELLQSDQPLPTPDESLPTTLQIFTVKKFEVIGSTVFSPEKLNREIAEFINKPITFAQLIEARSRITELYINAGYFTSEAYIPEQTLTSGVVRIQIIEGELEDIQITGTKRLNPNYIRSRIALGASTPLNQKCLLESLQLLLQLNPLIQNLSATLFAGSRKGANLLAIKVTEGDSFNIQTVLDNGGSPATGSFRRQLRINEANLLGFGDSISFVYSNTNGSNTIGATYRLPLNPRNGTLTFIYGNRSADVIERPFDFLDIESASQYYELTFRQPLVQTPNQEFAFGITAFRTETDISSLLQREGVPASELSPGADEEGRTRVSALRFFQQWTSGNSQEVIAARSEFSLGIGAFNATINETAPDSRFFAWRGQAQWIRLLAPDSLLLIRGKMQLASRRLLTSEQFSLSGINSVRGYRQDLLLADNGAFASVELRLPIARVSQWNGLLQVTPFVDVGTAWNNSSSRYENTNTLASVGLGLRWSQGNNFNAGVEWGIPLVYVNTQRDTWQENGLYFFVQYNPF
ncbi:MAG: ShlB/FhaC/HecB family hemolysin secretion/activation protein [Nostoc sp.]|uniref:ShlB/FhaC/HecB family hemolysin secretion/activation protein n=1 Tax=Nostoc sp. TaxID=1180 RepID=UPI002FF80B38